MESKISEALKLAFQPVAILWSDDLPERALQFKGIGSGCIMSMFAQAAAKGRTAAFSRTTFGCFGAGVGQGFGKQYDNFPFGGVEAFKYFLSTGFQSSGREEMIEGSKRIGSQRMADHFLKGEGFKKSPELAEKFVEGLPAIEVPSKYVIFKPLKDLEEGEEPVVVVFTVNPDQLSALIVLVSYDRDGNENTIAPMGAGCHQIGIFAYKELRSKDPRAVIGLTDLSARDTVRGILGKDVLTLAVPYSLFTRMESNVEGSFLERDLWKGMVANRRHP